ncbi:hypothetical protein [Yersinia pseudotuberculosis]|nr:hypothetical protein [Yersinia pseudotuberculosis]CFV22457.1 Polysaccharide biosynthesis protein [Yersinia pseudotuberculosis]
MISSNSMRFLSNKLIPPIVEQFIGPLALFILTPIIINNLGTKEYGLWILLLSLSMFSQVICFGVTAWIAKTISECLSISDILKVKRIVRSSLSLIFIIFLPFLFVFIFLYLFDEIDKALIEIIILCIMSCLFQEIDNLFANATKGFELFDYSLLMEAIGRVVWTGCIVVGILRNDIIFYTCVAIAAKSLIKYIIFSFFVIKIWIIPSYSIYEINSRLIESKWMFLQLLGGTSLSLFDRLLIPIVLGVNKLAAYAPCIQLAQLAFSVPAAANQVLMPMFSRFKSKGNYPPNWLKMVILLSIFSGVPCFLLFIFSQEILAIWINTSFSNENYIILRVLAVAYGTLSCLSTFHFIMLGIGESKMVAKINLLAGGLTMLATILVSQFGINYIVYMKFIYPIMQFKYLTSIKNFIKNSGQ